MNAPRCCDTDYIAFLLAAQRVFSCTEAARCQPPTPQAPAHDAFTRLLTREPPDTAALWQEARHFIRREEGLLVLDDTTLDKPYAKKMDLVTRHWSGKHQAVVWGINLQTLVWTGLGEGNLPCVIPCDVRLYQAGGPTKNEQFREMLAMAAARGFSPSLVLFDAWYSGLDNLKAIRDLGWHFLTRVRSNRTVNPDRSGHVAVSAVEVGTAGRLVQLKGFGLVRLFRTVSRDGRVEYWATSRLAMTEEERAASEQKAWGIESYHRSLKQHCGAERAQVRSAIGQGNHLLLAVRAYLRLEVHRLRTGVSHFEAKCRIVREAMRAFLADPRLANLATA
jgi:hypothetical protein